MALRQSKRRDKIVAYPDCLVFGPIDPPESPERREWIGRELGAGAGELRRLQARTDAFWRTALHADARCIVWYSRRSAQEYSGFLEWVRRKGDQAYDVVDLSDDEIEYSGREGEVRRAPMLSLAMVDPDRMSIGEFLARAQPLSAQTLEAHRAVWSRLRQDNAALRVLGEEGLMSAPITHFDALLLSLASERWLKVARLVGEALTRTMDPHVQIGDLFLQARIRALAEAGHLESRGDLGTMRYSEVRRPPRPSAAMGSPA